MTTSQRIDVAVTIFVRLFLAGVFGFAAYMKLRNEAAAQAFAESIQAFQVLDAMEHHHLVTLATFAVPWAEAICAVLILLGLWTRAASFVMLGALGVFMWAIYTIIARGLSVECGCFGDFNFPCDDTVGMCQMYRNGVLALGCLYLIIRGGGRVSLDRLLGPREPKMVEAGPVHEPVSTRPSRPATDDTPIPLDPVRPTPLSSSSSEPGSASDPPKPRWD